MDATPPDCRHVEAGKDLFPQLINWV
jgi:hypothetical protein